MRKALKILLLALAIGIAGDFAALAQTTTSISAASCNLSDVQSAVNALPSAGGTVQVPAGTCVWTSPLTVNAGVSIIGAGAIAPSSTCTFAPSSPCTTTQGSDQTIIEDDVSQGSLMNITLSSATDIFRLSNMAIEPSPALTWANVNQNADPIHIAGTCSSATCPHIRLDHLHFTGWVYDGYGNSKSNFTSFVTDANDVFGVVDHNYGEFTTQGHFMLVGDESYLGVGSWGDNSWAQPDDYGTDNAIYFENNIFSNEGLNGLNMALTDTSSGGYGGSRIVVRYNTMTNFSVYVHGTETSGRPRGGRHVEVYDNSMACTPGVDCATFVTLRSGTGLVFNNTISSNPYVGSLVILDNYRAWAPYGVWGECDGQGPYDDNDGKVYDTGTATVTGTTLTDTTKNWAPNQWAPNGDPYSVVDTTAGWGGVIISNTSNTITYKGYTNGSSLNVLDSVAVGDNYQILRATACADQPGRGMGTYISGGPPAPTGWVNQQLDPVYEWGDTLVSGPSIGWISSDTSLVIANRDFYFQNPNFDGTSGTGTGTLANRPATCTAGVAYWATDANNGNGALYICTAAGWPATWNYTPYQYPHWLVTGTATTSSSITPPQSVSVVSVK